MAECFQRSVLLLYCLQFPVYSQWRSIDAERLLVFSLSIVRSLFALTVLHLVPSVHFRLSSSLVML